MGRRQRAMLDLLARRGPLTRGEIMRELGLTRSFWPIMDRLTALHLIDCDNGRPQRYWLAKRSNGARD